ncbi:MurR/RpiR family transcriptional regulator [Kutzneria chonburiensis]|uniref:MurR/RpiR family transcriptional regulator n=1 Tax=Kutzneria chonburiensis TaxID=1483604 RepID=A0ABV6MPE4_9PSEU|nr:MurR/RpiR family transcriptional regulator [Kutzneria chonburiensis]
MSQRSGSTVDQIRAMLPGMPAAQRALAELILADPAGVARTTILDLSERCGVSTGSITRLCRSLGLSGYAALRIALASDSPAPRRGTWDGEVGIDAEDDIDRVAEVVAHSVGRIVAEAVAHLDLTDVERAAKLIGSAGRVIMSGVGGSSTVASELQQRLYRIGVPVWAWSDPHVALTGIALTSPGDVLVLFSHSGRTEETIALATEARTRAVTTVAVTNDPSSPLAELADIALVTGVSQLGFQHEVALARYAQLAVVDLIYITVARTTLDRTTRSMAVTAEAVRGRRGSTR